MNLEDIFWVETVYGKLVYKHLNGEEMYGYQIMYDNKLSYCKDIHPIKYHYNEVCNIACRWLNDKIIESGILQKKKKFRGKNTSVADIYKMYKRKADKEGLVGKLIIELMKKIGTKFPVYCLVNEIKTKKETKSKFFGYYLQPDNARRFYNSICDKIKEDGYKCELVSETEFKKIIHVTDDDPFRSSFIVLTEKKYDEYKRYYMVTEDQLEQQNGANLIG